MTAKQVHDLFCKYDSRWLYFTTFFVDDNLVKWEDKHHREFEAHSLEELENQLRQAPKMEGSGWIGSK